MAKGDHDSLIGIMKKALIPDLRSESVFGFKTEYQALSLLKKAVFLNTTIDRRAKAVETWISAERQCARTNFNLEYKVLVGDLEFTAILNRMQHFIKRTLGPVPKIHELDCRFGPGATALVKRGITLPKKYGRKLCCTPSMIPYAVGLRGNLTGFHWNPTTIEVVEGNHLAFVAKDASTDRAICVEPDLNVFVQLGIGAALRSRFKRFFNLEHQADVNRALVARARKSGLSTIDLSSASDTVSSYLVSLLFPTDWYDLMDDTRSRHTVIEGHPYETEKFSSMGNGFTFEVETIIFFALLRALGVPEDESAVFGDDIIVPKGYADEVIHYLNVMGFSVNASKTFLSGDFYESCGHDYFRDAYVRPIFWKKIDHVQRIVKMCNDISRMAYDERFGCRTGSVYRSYHKQFCRLLAANGSYVETPQCLGDIGVITDFDQARPVGIRNGNLKFKVLRFRVKKLDYSLKTNAYVAALNQPSITDVSLDKRVSQRVERPVRGAGVWTLSSHELPAWQWDGFGPWVE